VFPELLPASADMLRCSHCGYKRPYFRPRLLVVTGVPGVGKSTLCARLAGTIHGAILLDADVLALDMISVASPNQDYQAFWRSMLRLAHELAQNQLVVVFFSTVLPEQLLANTDALNYFNSAYFLCLTCSPDTLRTRLANRESLDVTANNGLVPIVERWSEFQERLVHATSEVLSTILDADRVTDEVEADVRSWILTHLNR
jgi:predicted kinase